MQNQQDLFDFEQMDDIMLGVPEELVALLDAFLRDNNQDLLRMLGKLDESKHQKCLEHLHKIKGIGASFGLKGFAASAAEAEAAIKNDLGHQELLKCLKKLHQVLVRSERELRQLRPNYLPPKD